jgi:hypothetical protein
VSAKVQDAHGNNSGAGTDSAALDTVAPNDGAAPTVEITTDANNDGIVNSAELNGSSSFAVKASFDKTKVVAGDKVVFTDGTTTTTVVLAAADITAGYASTTFAKPAEGATLNVSAKVQDAHGNNSGAGTDSAALDTVAPNNTDLSLSVSITTDANNDSWVNSSEIGSSTYFISQVTFDKTKATAGDKIVLSAHNGSSALASQSVTLTANDISHGFINVNFAKPIEGDTQTVSANYVSAAGNAATDTAPSDSARLDTTAPDPKAITNVQLIDDVAPQTGVVLSTYLTNDTQPEIRGDATGDVASVNIYDESYNLLGNAKVVNGHWSFTSQTVLADAQYVWRVVPLDAAGNLDQVSVAYYFTVDTQAPSKPPALVNYNDNVGPIFDGTSTALVTNDSQPGFNTDFKHQDGTRKLYVDGKLIAATFSTVDGTITPDIALKDGTYKFSYTLTDAAGNESVQSDVLTVTIDTTAPTFTSSTTATAVDDHIAANTLVYTAQSTDANSVSYQLKAEAGDFGKFSIDASTGAVKLLESPVYATKSTYNFTVVATDVAGNMSEEAVSLAVNTPASLASPTLSLANDTGSSHIDGVTNISTINVGGLVTGASWQYQVDAGNWVDGSGISFNASEGAHSYKVHQTLSGNTSADSSLTSVTLDTVKPSAPIVHGVPLAYYYSNPAFKDGVPMFVELPNDAELGDKVHVAFNGTAYVADGILSQTDLDVHKWSFVVPQSYFSTSTTPTFSAHLTDIAGNLGDDGAAVAPAPAIVKLEIDKIDDPDYVFGIGASQSSDPKVEISAQDTCILDNSVHFTGFAQPGSVVTIYDTFNGVKTELGTALFDVNTSNGMMQWKLDAALVDANNAKEVGDHVISAVAKTTGSELSSDESVQFKFTIQSKLQPLDLSGVVGDGQEHVLNYFNATPERIVLNLNDVMDTQGVLTINGDAKDTVVASNMDLQVVNDQTGTFLKHEDGYWQYDLDGNGRFDLLISDQIHRIYTT